MDLVKFPILTDGEPHKQFVNLKQISTHTLSSSFSVSGL